MTIEVQALEDALSEAANDGTVLIRYCGVAFYATSIEIKDGDIIIAADEDEPIE